MPARSFEEVVAAALRPAPRAFESVEAFWSWHVREHWQLARPVDRAFAGGSGADRLGYAFAAGYSAALHALVPDIDARSLASLAATEEQGAHPKFIRSSLTPDGDNFRLNGEKSWVTLAGTEVLVLVRAGEKPDGRADLRLLRIDTQREGVSLDPLPTPPFIPEIGHAVLKFENVHVARSEVLEGDGWSRWVKPFRTVEDLHVHAALMGYLVATGARLRWPQPLLEQMLSVNAALRSLAEGNPSSPAVHLSLAGCIAQSRALVAQLEPRWAAAPEAERERWHRDSPLLGVAGKAREARRLKAWEVLSGAPSPGIEDA